MAAPLEFRNYLRRVTLEELTAGVQPVRQQVNGLTVLYHPPQLQWRLRGKDGIWGEWCDVPFERQD